MTVHVLRNGHYALVRCGKDDEPILRTALVEKGFECGKTRDVVDIPALVDINIKRNGSWQNISALEIGDVVTGAGLMVAED